MAARLRSKYYSSVLAVHLLIECSRADKKTATENQKMILVAEYGEEMSRRTIKNSK